MKIIKFDKTGYYFLFDPGAEPGEIFLIKVFLSALLCSQPFYVGKPPVFSL